MAVLTVPNTFVPGTVADATQVNANFLAIIGWSTTIDSTNIGPAGIYASQIIPTSTSQATFGGNYTYTFPVNVTIAGVLSVASNVMVGTQGMLGSGTLSFGTSAGNGLAQIGTTSNTIQTIIGSCFYLQNNNGTGFLAVDGNGNLGVKGSVFATNVQSSAGVYTGVVSAIGGFQPGNGSTLSSPLLLGGTGSPNGVLTAPNGSLFMRYDGTGGNILYVNNSGSDSSGSSWVSL